jgi:DNA-directed RNA polymerase specialized sigma24 family protein
MTIEGQTSAEIAADLGISKGAVRQAKYRILHRLRQELDGGQAQ